MYMQGQENLYSGLRTRIYGTVRCFARHEGRGSLPIRDCAQINQGAVVVPLFVYFWHFEDDSSCTVIYIKARGSVKLLPV